MRKKSIYSKLRADTLLIAAISVLCVCLTAYAGIWYMRGSVIHISEVLGNSAAYDSMSALEYQEKKAVQELLQNKAVISDENLSSVAQRVSMLSETAGNIMSNPDRFSPRSLPFPDEAEDGNAVVKRIAEGVALEDVQSELEHMGNIDLELMSVHNNSESIISAYIGTESGLFISCDSDSQYTSREFDGRTRPWYAPAKEAALYDIDKSRPVIWTDVYEDYFGRGLIMTCASPYYDADGNFCGVAAVDMLLEEITSVVTETKSTDSGYAFIVDKTGHVVISDKIRKDSRGRIVTRELFSENGGFPKDTARRISSGETGMETVVLGGSTCYVVYTPLNTLDWSFVIVTYMNDVIAPAITSAQNITNMKNDALRSIDKVILVISISFGIIFLIVLAANIAMTKRISWRLAEPIENLCAEAKIIGSGELEHRLTVNTGDELETLAAEFNGMVEDIKQITREKSRISAELNVAHRIQAQILPHIYPPFPERKEFDIYAVMYPAHEVGGDFYDFFFVNSHTLALVIADVSGKGVPSALFMVIARTLIKNNAEYGISPGEVLESVNNKLCEGNASDMLVTAFLAYLDIDTGKLTYATAGHNPPLVCGKDGNFSFLETIPGFMLACWPESAYENCETTISPGGTLFLYTDGVTEAANRERQFYTDERLIKDINYHKDSNVIALLNRLKRDVDSFANGAEQSDDLTMLVLKYWGNS